MTASRSERTLRIEAEEALIGSRVFEAMRRKDWPLIIRIAEIARKDADPDLARTDPSRFRQLREAITRYHLQGLTHMTPERVREVLARHGIELQPSAGPAAADERPGAR
ncbi:hypothetical protein [Defluviimonas salinarum]|uniref:Uncharacterized protein n=1 Tax=Defluviimonas salinarum TaxID=2992147 RepID=A0ABT3J5Q0_9RHOB|nr:hypothetical protein [Defluviimonas salinarum]MCW3783021.1 hypothetical protein [Defluviimonas salinarum]